MLHCWWWLCCLLSWSTNLCLMQGWQSDPTPCNWIISKTSHSFGKSEQNVWFFNKKKQKTHESLRRNNSENVKEEDIKKWVSGTPLCSESDLGNGKNEILYVIQHTDGVREFCLQTDKRATVCVWMTLIRASYQYSGLSPSCRFPLFLSSGVQPQEDLRTANTRD